MALSSSRVGGPAAGTGSSGGGGAGPVPRTAAGAQEPAGPGAELCGLPALRGGGAEGRTAGHRCADHPGCEVSESVLSCRASICPLDPVCTEPNSNLFEGASYRIPSCMEKHGSKPSSLVTQVIEIVLGLITCKCIINTSTASSY